MRNVVQLCLAANDILFMRKWNYAFSSLRSLLRENGKMANIHLKKKKTNELGDRMMKKLLNEVIAKYGDLSVSRRSKPLASPNNWSAHHWQITIFYSTSSNNCSLLLFIIIIIFFLGALPEFTQSRNREVKRNNKGGTSAFLLYWRWRWSLCQSHI